MRNHFSELRAVGEQHAQQYLFQSFQEQTGPMKDVENELDSKLRNF